MRQIHRKSNRACPEPPTLFTDLETYIEDQKERFEQPGDTSCPDRESVDALKLEVELLTVVYLAIILYLGVALAIRWRITRRYVRDALVSLSRSNFLIVRLFVADDRAIGGYPETSCTRVGCAFQSVSPTRRRTQQRISTCRIRRRFSHSSWPGAIGSKLHRA